MASANKTATNDLLKGLKADIKSASDTEVKKSRYFSENELKSVHLQLLIKPSIKERIKAAAEANHRSMNDLINQILEEWLDKHFKD